MSQIQSLRDHVCSYIYDKIKAGQLQPHEKLNEAEICDDLKISRTPAREALIMLAADHIIDFIPRKGFYVREITVDDKLQYYAFMGNLDAFAATLAADNLDSYDIKRLQDIIIEIETAITQNRYDDYVKLQEIFHDIYINKSKNTPLIDTIHSLRDQYIPITYNKQKTDDKTYRDILLKTNKEHEKIVEYLMSKDTAALERYIKEIHWNTMYIDLL